MITLDGFTRRWQSLVIGSVVLVGMFSTGGNEGVFAQVIPDDTLGAESSMVTPDVIREILSDRIDGGATRGANLFHSFIEFNVAEGRGVYFTNPDGIENILSRVTGDNVSTILGRLGVLGEANLFLLNPNGILFGPNASLDIEGSFVATTASGIELGEDGVFSATQPRSSRLLSVSPGALFYNAVEAAGGKITNRGNLTTGRNLTLDGENLDLQGQLRSGRELTLQAQDTVTIRDSATNPFIAAAGGNLLVTGNQGIDIFALNHPDSGLFSGGDMVLRSAADVGGDAHYWSGGSFRIEQLDGKLGGLLSPEDPVIRASGDVSFDSYQGASLHILAGGSVTITGDVEITGTDTSENSIQERVILSDGTPIEIDGSKQPTLDIRAGTTAFGTGGVTGETAGFSPMVPGTGGMGTRGDIRIDGNVTNPGGVVFLTNQYQSNLAGDIRVSRIDTMNRSGDGGTITIDSRGDIFSTELLSASGAFVKSEFGYIEPEPNFNQNAANGGAITLMAQGNIVSQDIVSGSYSGGGDTGDGGDIRLSAGNDISFGDNSQVDSGSFSDSGNAGDGGDISLGGGDISFGDDSGVISSSYSFIYGNTGDGGDISLSGGDISFGDFSGVFSASFSREGNAGDGGDISLSGGDISFGDDSGVSSFSYSREGNTGDGGDISLSGGDISFGDNSGVSSFSYSREGNTGDGGDISLSGGDISFGDNSGVYSYSYSDSGNAANGGEISLIARDGDIIGTSTNLLLTSFALSEEGEAGNGGNVTLEAGNAITNLEILTLSSSNQAGAVEITGLGDLSVTNTRILTSKQVEVDGLFSNEPIILDVGGEGQPGDVTIRSSGNLTFNNSSIESDTNGSDNAGEVKITSPGRVTFNNSQIISTTSNIGNAGDIFINAGGGITFQGLYSHQDTPQRGGLFAGTTNQGFAGTITLTTPELTLENGANIATTTESSGKAGNITLQSHPTQENLTINLAPETSISASTNSLFNQATGGDIKIKAPDAITIQGEGTITTSTTGTGNAGTITLDTSTLTIARGAEIFAFTNGSGDSGTITVNATTAVNLGLGVDDFSPVLSVETRDTGKAGNIIVNTPSLTLSDTARITATATNTAMNPEGGGSISLNASTMNLAGIVGVFADTQGQTPAGTLTLKPYQNQSTLNLTLAPQSRISASTSGSGRGGNLEVSAPEAITIRGAGTLAVETTGEGAAGNLTIDTQRLTIADGATISASTASANPDGFGGNITINATESFTLNQAQLSAQSTGVAQAGNITINTGQLTATDGTIATSTEQSAGGAIAMTASDIRLFGDSDITSRVASGAGGGGNITLTADSIIALDDSDILAFARDGKGGDITLTTPAFFGQNYQKAPKGTDPRTLDNNDRVDINATGAIEGVITITSDTGFIENSFIQLSGNGIDTDELIAESCIARRHEPQRGSFFITGTGGIPFRPGDLYVTPYQTGTVRSIPSEGDGGDGGESSSSTRRPWKIGDPIIEPTGIYRLPNGELIMSRECGE